MSVNKSMGRFLLIWSGELVSGIGSGLTAFALAVYMFRKTGLATSTALVYLAGFLPAFLLRPVGGVLADRFDRRLLMVIGNLGSASGILLILVLMSAQTADLWAVYPGAALSSLFVAFHSPAYKASVTDFLPKELYAKASGLLQLSGAAPLLLAPFAAGLLLSAFDIRLVLLIDILSFVSAALIIIVMRKAMRNDPGPGETDNAEQSRIDGRGLRMRFADDMAGGLRAVGKNRGVLLLTVVVSCVLFFVGLLQTLLGPMILIFSDAATLGTAQSVCAAGMLLSSLLIGGLSTGRRQVPILSASLAAMGSFFAFIGMRENIPMIIVPGFLFFFTLPFVNSSIEVLIRKNVDNTAQGRVWAMVSFITYFGLILAFAAAGFLSDAVFNPLFLSGGLLADSLGHVFGTGPGRGIAFLFFLSGIGVLLLSLIVRRSASIRALESNGLMQARQEDRPPLLREVRP